MARAARRLEPGNPALRHGDTTFLVTADDRGQMVSLIQSNYTGFGSGYVVPELGFGIQDRGALFTLQAGHPNALAPGKRPFHTIIPAFLGKDGVPLMAFGVMGGDMQPQGHVQVLLNILDFGMNLQEAGDAPRFYHTGSSEPTGTVMEDGGVLYLESGVPFEVRQELLRRGHRIQETERHRLRRLPGDLARPRHRRLHRRHRVPQGRLRGGILIHPPAQAQGFRLQAQGDYHYMWTLGNPDPGWVGGPGALSLKPEACLGGRGSLSLEPVALSLPGWVGVGRKRVYNPWLSPTGRSPWLRLEQGQAARIRI